MNEISFIEKLARWHDIEAPLADRFFPFQAAQHRATADALRRMEAAIVLLLDCIDGNYKKASDQARSALQPPTKEKL